MTVQSPPNDDATPTTRQRDPLSRGIAVLTHMAESELDEFGVRQLASAMSTSASTTHRLLNELEQLELIARTSTGGYRLGLGFYRLASRGLGKFPLRTFADRPLRQLAHTVDETTFFSIYDEAAEAMTFAATAESTKPLRYVVELDQRMPLHAGASGLAILAWLPDTLRRSITRRNDLAPVTDSTITDGQELEGRLANIRQRGYAISSGERIPGALAIAAPVFGPLQTVIGCIGVTMPAAHFDPTREGAIARDVISAAENLTTLLRGS